MQDHENKHEPAIREVIDKWAKAVRDSNMDGILDNHTPDILMYDAVPPFQSEGLELYKKTWELFFKYSTGGDGSFNLKALKITAGDTVAFATATLHVFSIRVRLTLGLRNINGRWLIAHEHHSGLDEK